MTTFELKYNPYAVKTDFYIDGKETSLECFGTGRNVRLREYINDFFPAAIKKSNLGPGSDCLIQFYGTQDAFDDVKAAYQKYSGLSEGVKIELLEYKPYPNNFNEMNILIDEKRKQLSGQIAFKKEGLANPSAGKSNVDITDVEKRFSKDKILIEQTYSDCLDKMNSVIEKAKEEVDFLSSAGKVSFDSTYSSKTKNSSIDIFSYIFEAQKAISLSLGIVEIMDAKVYYDKIIEQYNLVYTKTCGELTDLLSSLLKKVDSELYSGFETIYKNYSAAYSNILELDHPITKYKQSSSFVIKETIPDSCFGNMKIMLSSSQLASSTVNIGIATIKEMVCESASSCRTYFDSVSESAKKELLLETDKCIAYYLEEFTELQNTIKEKLTSTKHIEQEITALENKIECLDELQNEINKLAAN